MLIAVSVTLTVGLVVQRFEVLITVPLTLALSLVVQRQKINADRCPTYLDLGLVFQRSKVMIAGVCVWTE